MLKRLFNSVVIGGILALAAGLAATPAAAQSKISVPLLLCPAGCGPTESDTILMVQMIKEGSPVTLLPQETPGYMYNIREMGKEGNWKRFVFSTEDVLIQLAMKWGGTPEIKEFLPEAVPIRFKLLYGETWWAQGKFFVTFDPNIKRISDLKGKRISLGLRSQSDWGVLRIVLAEYGITPENSDIRHLTPAALTSSTDRWLDRRRRHCVWHGAESEGVDDRRSDASARSVRQAAALPRRREGDDRSHQQKIRHDLHPHGGSSRDAAQAARAAAGGSGAWLQGGPSGFPRRSGLPNRDECGQIGAEAA